MSSQKKETAPISHNFKEGKGHPPLFKGGFIKKEE
jgi:hypothetical protein